MNRSARAAYIRLAGLLQALLLSLLMAGPEPDADSGRPRIGLVLSGGGAKGFAHLGTLKLLDSLQIPIDYIAGTSMGALVGAAYAVGYSGVELEEIIKANDWMSFFSDTPPRDLLPYLEKKSSGRYQLEFGMKHLRPQTPSGLISGQKASLFLSKLTSTYSHITDFDQLPIPFRCVAVDLITGNEVVLKSGSLTKALRSTMSIPSWFAPVEWGDSLLVDGGLVNNLPVDVVREMGADIVIAVNVGTPKRNRAGLKTALGVLEQAFTISAHRREEINIRQVDILISPQLGKLGLTDFNPEQVAEILRRGDAAAGEAREQLLEMIADHGLSRGIPGETYVAMGDSTRIHGVIISGNTMLPFKFINHLLDLKPGDLCTRDTLLSRLKVMRETGCFQSIDYRIQPVRANSVRLILQIKDRMKPQIYGVSITGNHALPFIFIFELLGIKPGSYFDPTEIEQQITDLYSLGYFESITYEVEPVDQERVRLIFRVKERSLTKLRLGLRYDDLYQLVAILGLQMNNFLTPGMRLESDLEFAGLIRYQAKMYYPSRTLQYPIYPFIQLAYRDIPINIFSMSGNKEALYHDRASTVGIGLGFLPVRGGNFEVEINRERINTDPIIASDSASYPQFSAHLIQFTATFNLDRLDDVLLPHRGYLVQGFYEKSALEMGSDLEYWRANLEAGAYLPVNRRLTLNIGGSYIRSSSTMPIYKYYYYGGPGSFIGTEYNQLLASRMTILRVAWRYRHRRHTYLKLFWHTVFDFDLRYRDAELGINANIAREQMHAFGVGILYMTPFGPIELIISQGRKSTILPSSRKNHLYFSAGYKF